MLLLDISALSVMLKMWICLFANKVDLAFLLKISSSQNNPNGSFFQMNNKKWIIQFHNDKLMRWMKSFKLRLFIFFMVVWNVNIITNVSRNMCSVKRCRQVFKSKKEEYSCNLVSTYLVSAGVCRHIDPLCSPNEVGSVQAHCSDITIEKRSGSRRKYNQPFWLNSINFIQMT